MNASTRRYLLQLTLPLALLGTATVTTALSSADAATVSSTAPHFAHARIHIPGMTCSNHSCATTVYLSLIRLPGVMGVNIDEATQDVTVKYIPSKTTAGAFLKAVGNAGYPGTLVTMKKD